jgi:hypothetical protein
MTRDFATGLCLLGWLLAGCAGEEREKTLLDTIEQENADIRAFLEEHARGPVTTLRYLSKHDQVIDCTYIFNNTPPRADSVSRKGDFVLYDYSIQRLDGSYVESTDPEVQADTFRYAVPGPIYHRTDSTKRYDYVGDALAHVAEGTRGEMIVPSILRDKSGVPLHYTLKAWRVIPDLFEYEKALIRARVDELGGVARYEDGEADTLVHTVVLVAGTGDRQPRTGDTVTFYRVLMVLDEVSPLRVAFPLDTLVTNSFNPAALEVPALGKGLARLRAGDEAEVVIPYVLGFNDKPGYHPDDKRKSVPWIPPYATLVYSVKMVEVKEKKE